MSKRDSYFDSLKFILISLVVFGHILEYSLVRDSLSFRVYSFIYAFHMPLFIFVSGYFSKNMTWDKLKKSFKTLLPAYFVFQTIMSIPGMLAGSFNLFDYLTSPQGILWYIPALLYWRAAFYLVARIKFLNAPAVIALSVLATLLAGFVNYPVFLALAKSVAFLPYFALGYYCTEGIIAKIRSLSKSLSVAVLVALFIAIYLLASRQLIHGLYGEFSYRYAFGSISFGLLYRIAILVAAVVASCAVINIATPKFSRWGSRTLDIYLLQAPLIYIFYGMVVRGLKLDPHLGTALLAFAVIMPLCILLMQIKVLRYLINPSLLFERKNKVE